jgi:(1->4)-alpha-D-glucan 1-alpha-D-glucosylmutase
MTSSSRHDAPSRVPVSSYRLQFNQALTFADAAAIVDYLAALGVTECYASPLLAAGPGSTHGYDISDHNRLNPELGGDEAFERFAAALKRHQMGLILDFVPNHMGINPSTNAWWRDVLENGPSSSWSTFFDIDWTPIKPELRDRVLLPILGDQYGLVLERGELRLRFEKGALDLTYFDHVLPINPRQTPRVYRHGIDDLHAALGEEDADFRELMSILTALSNLPPYTDRDPALVADRKRETEVSRDRLLRLVTQSPRIAQHIDAAVTFFNGRPGDAASFNDLHALLELQPYRLAYWRTAFDEINYRRFFDVNQLAALRMEDPRVFESTHGLLLDLIARDLVTGVRIDHPDGLFDPAGYFGALQQAAAARKADARAPKHADAATGPRGAATAVAEPQPTRDDPSPPPRDLYVIAEKILSAGELLPSQWPIHGTTGYNALNVFNGLFVRGHSLNELKRAYRAVTSQRRDASDVVYMSKVAIMRTSLSSELNVLAHALNRISESDRRSRDFTLNTLRRALVEVVAVFPVYRTYVTVSGATAEDERIIDEAIAEARRRDPVMESSIFKFVRDVLLPPQDSNLGAEVLGARTYFAMKLQQFTGPVQAKGLEDTAFYRDVPLVSANEVGGDPHHAAWTEAEFHASNLHRQQAWRFEMTTTATHDTKRGEDTRMRINVISEIPRTWSRFVTRWAAINEGHRTMVARTATPDRNDEWLFYQSLVGAWPVESPESAVVERASDALVDRMKQYMLKAVKEAKRHTSWVNVNAAYDESVVRFVAQTLTGPTAAHFLQSFVPLQRRLAWFGMVNSLAQVVLRLASPGMPDVYQGCELWDLSLVDPDNRRPVDFAGRRTLLESLEPLLSELEGVRMGRIEAPHEDAHRQLAGLFETWWDGRIKLLTTAAALRLRRSMPDVFLSGDYVPLRADAVDGHVIAFARSLEKQLVIAMAPRFLATKFGGKPRSPVGLEAWETTRVVLPREMAQRTFVNVLTGESVRPLAYRGSVWLLAGDVFTTWPIALLVGI